MSIIETLAALPDDQVRAMLSGMTPEELERIRWDWRTYARPKQLPPPGDWSGWMILAGRGAGKTRTGAEWVRSMAETGRMGRMALIAETAADCRDVLVEGESGILAISPPWNRPVYESSKRRLTWPNGAIATLYNGTEPDQLRGPQHDGGWLDELAKYRYAQETFDMFLFGLRLGNDPRYLITTTPRPIKLIKALMIDPNVVVTRGSSMENIANLSPMFKRNVIDKYAGTRLGRQEIDAEILEDVPGALWTRRNLDEYRVNQAPDMMRIVVGVDPAATSNEDSNEHGIVVAGLDGKGHAYVMDDWTAKGSPDEWGRKAVAAYRRYQADQIIAESNQGGDMVEHVIRSVSNDVNVMLVRASRGKYTRAEPVSALFEQGRVHMVGTLPALEDQMIAFTPQGTADGVSPDRVDAMVWALTSLFPDVTAADGVPVAKRYSRPAGEHGWMN